MLSVVLQFSGGDPVGSLFGGALVLLFMYSALFVALPWLIVETAFFVWKRRRCENVDSHVWRFLFLVPWLLVGVAVAIWLFV